ncbi:MAG: hypothetical protein Q9182_000937 [Xanthomendoza sp. 2 TL-2023]
MIVSAISCITIYTQCNPPRALWEHVPNASCWNPHIQADIGIFQGAWNAFMDLVLALLPTTVISKLNMKRSKKVALCILLGLGVVGNLQSLRLGITKPDTHPYQPVSAQSTDIKFVPRQPSKAHLGNATFEDSDIHVERTFELDVTLRDSLRNSKDTTQGTAEERREVTGHDLV